MRLNRPLAMTMTLTVLLALAGRPPARGQQAPEKGGRRFALLIGVRQYYKEELRDLKYSELDAKELADVLRENGYRVVLMTQSAGSEDSSLFPSAANIRRRFR